MVVSYLLVAALVGMVRGEAGVSVWFQPQLQRPVKELAQEFKQQTGVEVRLVATETQPDKAAPGVWLYRSEHHRERQPGDSERSKVVARTDKAGGLVVAELRGDGSGARRFWQFLDSPTSQAIWGKWNYRVAMQSDAELYDRFVSEKLRHTYPATAMRMLAECGMRQGLCIDVGCGTGLLDIELARRSKLRIIGLDIDPEMIRLARRRVRQAGLQQRISFVVGDVHAMPFEDDSADMIVSRGSLPFFKDKAKALREVWRVLKPTGVAFLGGRYLYMPRKYVMTTDQLRAAVRRSGVPGAQVIEGRGQWVKMVGPEAPAAARRFAPGPAMAAYRAVIDSGIDSGQALVIGGRFPDLAAELAQDGRFHVTVLAGQGLRRPDKLPKGLTWQAGAAEAMPFPDQSFHLVISVGQLPFWSDKGRVLREVYRVLRPGGYALLGGRYLYMPAHRRVSSQRLRQLLRQAGIRQGRVIEEMGQWVEIRRGGRRPSAP